MPNGFRASRRVILLGVVSSLAFLGFSLPRPVLKAQEPAKATDRKTLREQIVALHAEIDLMEVEQGVDRQLLSELIKVERESLIQIDAFVVEEARSPRQKFFEQHEIWGWWIASLLISKEQVDDEELRKKLSKEIEPEKRTAFKDSVVGHFGQEFAEELETLVKIENKEKFSELRKLLTDRAKDHVRNKATERVRQKTAPLKKEFTRRSAELAGKKLDLDTLERQYHEARCDHRLGSRWPGMGQVSRFDEAAFLRLVRGESRGPASTLARLGLSGLAGVYRVGVATRNLAFDRGWKASHRAGVPVISVGNLTLGGTGKTPMVEWIGRWYRTRGVRVAILSRGYGDSTGLNDEGRVLEENLPDVPHLQSPDRVVLARCAVEELESEILVLDDGFQHRQLARDLDVVLLDALDPFGLGRIFPRGLLREPIGSLRRAGVVVLSRADLVDGPTRAAIRDRAERTAGPLRWVLARHAPLDLIDAEGRSFPLEDARERSLGAFCGIGNPEGFRRTLAGLDLDVAGFRAFPDHHPYGAADVADLAAWLRGQGSELALTTQKDLVKLRTLKLGSVPLLGLRIGLEFLDGSEPLDLALAALLPSGKDQP